MTIAVGLLILVVTAVAVARRFEVRLVLLTAAFALATLAATAELSADGDFGSLAAAWMQIARTFVATLSNEKFVVPICSAMGFAYVLRHTECDQHLVRLLIRPFRRVRPLLVPATVGIGFLVNIPLVSQTSTAVAVGTVLVPLLRASGVSPLTIGAALVLGSSLGGELLNPAAPELLSVARALQKDLPQARSQDCVAHVHRLIWWHLLLATFVFWIMNRRNEANADGPATADTATRSVERVRWDKAVIPFVPLILLFLTSPAFGLMEVPLDWLTGPKDRETFDSRLIGVAMLIGAVLASATMPTFLGRSTAIFFEGAGYGFTHIIGLIVAASCFGEGIKLLGWHLWFGEWIERYPTILIPAAVLVPMLFALISGSGMAATQSLFEFYVAPIHATGADPFRIGAYVAIGAAAGRTMSPVAAVVLMAARMTETEPFQVARKVAFPLLVGLLALMVAAIFRLS
ncbi:MAG: C4-dicarboxylate transporter DcuC [Gemmataceae bacterium]|nr:C4-dicarboxylate transporter DcuC [Gemmataceae bacterium]